MAQDSPPASNDPVRFDYAEKDTGPGSQVRGNGPRGQEDFWTLGGVDADDFTIVGGDLRFKSSPDYENPTDRDEDTVNGGAQRAGDNIYRVTVRFGAAARTHTRD